MQPGEARRVLVRQMVLAEREELIRLRDADGLPDIIVRDKLRDLDLRLQALETF